MSSLVNILDSLTVEGELYESLPDDSVRCYACGHRCLIREGKRGICQVRFNQGGKLRVPWGYVAALQSDPIEKKPFSHVMPGTNALTFGMLGCDYHCGYCQNWLTSQAMRDPASDISDEVVTTIHLPPRRSKRCTVPIPGINAPTSTGRVTTERPFEISTKAIFWTTERNL